MRRYRREFTNRTIHIPRAMLDLLPTIYNLRNEGYDDDEIAKHLNQEEINMWNLLHAITPSSLDAPVSEDAENSLSLADVIRGNNIGFDEMESEGNIDYYIQKVADSMKDDKKKKSGTIISIRVFLIRLYARMFWRKNTVCPNPVLPEF